MERRVVGRYVMHEEIAAGGMATVHLGRLIGPAGFARTVAIKKLHAQFAKDPEFVAMFLDEARLAARVRHPNVVSTLDVVALGSELFLVMDYIQGESVSGLIRGSRKPFPPAIACTIASETLLGLHAAHEATDDRGEPLSIVHRDVSPQNVLVGVDGIARVVDFGVAKAAGRLQSTRDGQVKGKAAYMSPEQLRGDGVDRRSDVYACGVVLWEMLTGQRLFAGGSPEASMVQVLEKLIEPPSTKAPHIPAALDAIVLRATARRPEDRFATAREMATRLDDVMGREPSTRIGDWVHENAEEKLAARAARIARIESDPSGRQSHASEHPKELQDPTAATLVAVPEQVPSLVVTSSSVRGASSRTPSRRPPLLTLATAIVGVSALSAAGYELGVHRAPTTASASVLPALSVARPSEEPTVEPERAAVPPPTATTPPPLPSVAPPPPPPVVRPVRPSPRSAAPSCTPPYTIDANGYHIPKPQCL